MIVGLIRKTVLALWLVSCFGTRAQGMDGIPSRQDGTRTHRILTDTIRKADCREVVPASFSLNGSAVGQTAMLDSLAAVINRTTTAEDLEMRFIRIGGMSSPDGPEATNIRLAGERAGSVADYLRTHTRWDESNIEVVNLGEGWDMLLHLLKAGNHPFAKQIRALCDTVPEADRREAILRRMDGGRVWRSLIADQFPRLRCVTVELCRDSLAILQREQAIALQERKDTIPVGTPPATPPVSAVTPSQPPVVPPEPEDRTRFVAVKTNLPHLAMLAANLGVEIQLADRWSVDLPVWYNPYNMFSSRRKWRMLATQPEARYWTKEAGAGHFVGVHAHLVGFNVALKSTERYQDPNHAAWGFGAGYGFARPFGKNRRWAVDANIGLGFVSYKYDTYYNIENGALKDSGSGTYWGVTRLGVSISYRWFWKAHTKKGGAL